MGTQQILLIVVSVIIVGVSISSGIALFGNQAYKSNQHAMLEEMSNIASILIQYWKTPASMGGAGQNSDNIDKAKIAAYIGFATENDNGNSGAKGSDAEKGNDNGNNGGNGNKKYVFMSENGEFRIKNTSHNEVTITCLGKASKGNKHPYAETTINLVSGAIETDVSESEGY